MSDYTGFTVYHSLPEVYFPYLGQLVSLFEVISLLCLSIACEVRRNVLQSTANLSQGVVRQGLVQHLQRKRSTTWRPCHWSTCITTWRPCHWSICITTWRPCHWSITTWRQCHWSITIWRPCHWSITKWCPCHWSIIHKSGYYHSESLHLGDVVSGFHF